MACRRQAIIWTYAGILLIGPAGTNFSEILIEILTFSFKETHLKMSSGKWQPFYLCLNVLEASCTGQWPFENSRAYPFPILDREIRGYRWDGISTPPVLVLFNLDEGQSKTSNLVAYYVFWIPWYWGQHGGPLTHWDLVKIVIILQFFIMK